MKRLIIIVSLLAAMSLGAEETVLTDADILGMVTGNNAAVRISAAGQELALRIYEQVLGSLKPGISFSTDTYGNPLYGYGNTAYTSYGVTGVIESHTISGSLSVSGMLPTGGNAGFSLDNSLVWSRNGGEETWGIAQNPAAAVSVFQPVFVNGSFLDPQVREKTMRNGEIGWEISRVKDLDTRNRIIGGVLSAVHQVKVLRESVVLLEMGLELADLRLEMAAEDRNRGRISESDLLSIELDVGRQREVLFDAGYRLVLSEIGLAGMLGLESLDGYDFRLDYGMTDRLFGESADTVAGVLSGNPAALQATLEAEKQELAEDLNGVQEAPVVSLVFQAGPRYPGTREDESDFSASFTDFFADGADVDLSFGLAVQFNAWDGGLSAARRKADRAALVIARESRDEALRAAAEERKTLLARLELIDDRIKLLESNILYDRRLLQREIERRSLGASTKVDVETVRLELLGRERDVTNLRGERYLLGLQLLSLSGESLEDFLLQ